MGGKKVTRFGLMTLLAIHMPTLVIAQSSNQRIDWRSLSAEDQTQIKQAAPAQPQTKNVLSANASQTVFHLGEHRQITQVKNDQDERFDVAGIGFNLSHAGRIRLHFDAQPNKQVLEALQARFGLSNLASVDSKRLVWSAFSQSGLNGLKIANEIASSGLTRDVEIDWQRKFAKK